MGMRISKKGAHAQAKKKMRKRRPNYDAHVQD